MLQLTLLLYVFPYFNVCIISQNTLYLGTPYMQEERGQEAGLALKIVLLSTTLSTM